MNSVLFVYIKTENEEISGHIDLTARIQTENFLPYLTGAKVLMPTCRDLSYFSWPKNKLRFDLLMSLSGSLIIILLRIGKSQTWKITNSGIKMMLKHLETGQSYPAIPRHQKESSECWIHLDQKEKFTKISCLDIVI